MKPERLFYVTAGAVFLVLVVIGFRHYIFGGTHRDGSTIDPTILKTVVLHSSAIFAWFVLFFVQALLISTQNRRLHMKLGWSVLVVAATIVITGPIVAVRSVQLYPNDTVFNWPYPRFLLIMLTEIVLYTFFVAVGVLNRKRPRIHRPMMLMASLTILTGATARTASFAKIFGGSGWVGFFGPVLCLGAFLLLVRWAMTRSLDRYFAVSYTACAVVLIAVAKLAMTNTWMDWAGIILRLG